MSYVKNFHVGKGRIMRRVIVMQVSCQLNSYDIFVIGPAGMELAPGSRAKNGLFTTFHVCRSLFRPPFYTYRC